MKQSSKTENKPSQKSKFGSTIAQFAKQKSLISIYFWFSICALIGTSFYWTYLGARYQLENADQLVNSMLFTNLQGLHDALLPNAHSFLVKWPLFLIGGLLGYKSAVLIALTIFTSLATVISLAYILHKIEKRPVVIATIYLIISSMLLLVPTAPYAGALLPVNMSMLATRNIEYIIYIWALYCIVRGSLSWRSKSYVLGLLLLTLLFASDKLFVSLSMGGALLIIGVYSIARKWRVVKMGTSWLMATVIATASSVLTLWLVNLLGITHIISGGSGLGPYGLIHSARELALGIFYAFFGILTNFGANPAYDAIKLSDIPQSLKTHLLSFGILGFSLNLAFLSIGLYLSFLLTRATLTTKIPKNKQLPFAPILSIMLIASGVTSIATFILSKHYYPVDSRYLAICFFALIIAATTFIQATSPKPKKLIIIGALTSLAIVTSLVAITQTHSSNLKPLQIYSDRNNAVMQALKNRHVQYLVGDYWRVVPIGQKSNITPTISPLANCTEYRQGLTSTQWQPDLKNSSFAYLLSTKKGLTDFPACNLDDVTKKFGKPSSSTIIAGTIENPEELLLFYDNGKKSSPKPQSTTVLPTLIDNIIPPSCNNTELNIVAHQDDDLLFMNPDIQSSINEGKCMRTVYLTAGDAGSSSFYWLGREKGAEAAYSQMSKTPVEQWIQKNIKISDSSYITMASPKSNLNITLIYFRLPDGGPDGQGFIPSQNASLAKLYSRQITSIKSVDNTSTYTNEQLVSSLNKIIEFYKPNLIRTQSTTSGISISDHADHTATSEFAKLAFGQYVSQDSPRSGQVALRQYTGYPTRESPQNITSADLDNKMATFLAYAQNDGAVCHSQSECLETQTYMGYLERQYYN